MKLREKGELEKMERKKASALVGLLMILLASFALVTPIPPASAQPTGTYRYWVMSIARGKPGNVVINDSLAEAPAEQGVWNFTIPPILNCENITFSAPRDLSGYGKIVDLAVPRASYVGIDYMFYDPTTTYWIRFHSFMTENGYGWIFLNDTGDVDCHTFSNNSAAYWRSPSPKAGEKAANHGAIPSPGSDGVAGTGDDGFGDGNPDPRGSSILILPIKMSAWYYGATDWVNLFNFTWPQVYTTGNASSKIIEPDGGPGAKNASQIDGAYQTEVGQPWEFYAGLDHPGDQVSWNHKNSTVYVTYVCAWSLLDVDTALGDYDNCFKIAEKLVRDDFLIADINCNEEVDIYDITLIGLAYKGKLQNFGGDKTPYTGDDKLQPDARFDGRADLKVERGEIDIFDLTRCGLNYKWKFTSKGISRP